MIEQVVRVSRVEGTKHWLQPEKNTVCEGCNGRCATATMARIFSKKAPQLELEFTTPLSVGQKLKLGLADEHLLGSAFLIYLCPLLLALLLVVISALLFKNEGLQLLLSLGGAMLGFQLSKKYLKQQQYSIEVIKIYPISLPLAQINGD